jgi:hypothetical protein
MTNDAGVPASATPMVDGQTETTAWDVALDRLQHPSPGQNHWLATVRPDGSPHLMPIIAFWIDGGSTSSRDRARARAGTWPLTSDA